METQGFIEDQCSCRVWAKVCGSGILGGFCAPHLAQVVLDAVRKVDPGAVGAGGLHHRQQHQREVAAREDEVSPAAVASPRGAGGGPQLGREMPAELPLCDHQ